MVKGDFAAQHAPLEKLKEALARMRLKGLDDLGTELKGKVLTLLLRVGRQTKEQEDPEKEAARLGVHDRLARVWMAVGDERRAANALAASGKDKAASALLKQSGDWEARVELAVATGDHAQAAGLLESHGKLAEAAEAYAAAGNVRGQVRVLGQLGDSAAVAAVLQELDPDEAAKLADKLSLLDAWAQLLAEREEWPRLAKLYQSHGQHGIAAQAFERAGDFSHAYKVYALAGDGEGMNRCLEEVVEARLAKNDVLGAAQAWATAGRLDKAAEVAAEKHPGKAHQWFVEGGYVDRALELARHQARKAEGHDDYETRATWLARAGDNIAAATLWEGMQRYDRAQVLYEKAHAWEAAGRCAEALDNADEAVELYYRANLPDEAERVKLMGVRKPEPAPPAE